MDILDLINSSSLCTIGYCSTTELHLMSLLNLLDDIDQNIYLGYDDVISSGDVLSFLSSQKGIREYKLNSLLNKKNVNIVLNLDNVSFEEFDNNEVVEGNDKVVFRRALFRKNLINSITGQIYTMNNTDSDIKYRLIVLTSIYKSITPSNNESPYSIKGGAQLLYNSDLVIYLVNDLLKIVKNRFSKVCDYTIDSALRECKLKYLGMKE